MFKLIKLYSNKESFHTIEFKDGLNIVIGETESFEDKQHNKRTLNGVGKSLIIKIIDFCLGSDNQKRWQEPLKGWVFCLDYTLNNVKYSIKRCVDNQDIIYLDDKKMSVNDFRIEMKKQLDIDSGFTYRQCISRYLRKGKNAYSNYLTTISKEKECDTLKILIYLLGLDYSMCNEKIKLKKNYDEVKNLLNKIKTDTDFRNMLVGENIDTTAELERIDNEILHLEEELDNYKFAEALDDIKNKADSISLELNELNNKKYVIKNNIRFINESLKQEISSDFQSIKEMYEEIGLLWPDSLVKTIEEVNKFHSDLLTQRKISLNKDLDYQKNELKRIDCLIQNINCDFNDQLKFLDKNNAMDKYAIIIKKIEQLKERKNRVNQVATIEKNIEENKNKIEKEFKYEKFKAGNYLNQINPRLNELDSLFVDLTKEFYSDKKSSLLIKDNQRINQKTFDIDARIESDGSDGIKEVIIFCFDWILLNSNIIKQGFMYHDSLLISNVEKRQKEVLFDLANKLCMENKKQYIININYDQILGFKEDTLQLINDNTILTLTDKSEKNKLLGIEVDLGTDSN